ncbi:AAA family ATPase [Campylobacter helveticus]|uniref:AAA family ATPase n=1 Tax=Campylobacter helveticus TaxID=28898 RepID=UPI0010519653|nr:AAA family ATPase [Campylobacter helveticus]ELU1350283.1 ATP-binding protein [Campylobacter jejuni]MCR2062564.1 AAA family ATPase [Campylobacter helveticus]QBL12756.1 ATP-binding protein [Campylobacter helveticus]
MINDNLFNLYFIIKEPYYLSHKKLLEEKINETLKEYSMPSTHLNNASNSKNYILLLFPSQDEIKHKLCNLDEEKALIIIASMPPLKEYESFFIIKKLPNLYNLLSSTQKAQGITEEMALEYELGLSVINSPFTLKDIGGAKPLKTYTAQLIKAEEKGYKAKGIFLVGIPGTGKTFFPKCFAGELNRKLIALNLSQIMESDEPITKLNHIFEYLHQRKIDFPDEKFVILIDEIEKMIGNASPKEKQMLGRLLTILNDINTPACEYNFNAIFFATANDLGSILENNPEFLRRGRWDELFFISLPTHEYATEMFEIYFKKYKLDFVLELMSLDEIFAEIEHLYQRDNPISDRFPYTPAEIENFCKRLDFVNKAEECFRKEHILECVELIIPLGKSARKGIEKMSAQKELFIEI